jgi:hypothetical protein
MTVCYQVKREFKTGGPPRRMGLSIGGPPSASGGGSGWKPSDYLKQSGRKNVTMPPIWALAFIDSKILIGKAPGSADDVRRFKKTTFSVNAKQTLSPRRVPRCQCIRSVQPHAPPVVGVTPVRARGRSWMYIALSRIRASDRKRRSSPRSRSRQNASSTLEDPRQRANPKFPKGDRRPSFSARGCMQGSEQLHWSGASQPGGPLLNGLFLRRAATLFPWSVALLAKSCQHVLCRLPDTWRR